MLLEDRWVYFTPTGLTLCLRTIGIHTSSNAASITLDRVRRYMLGRDWSPRHLGDVHTFLQHCPAWNNMLHAEATVRDTLHSEYQALPQQRELRALLVGFLDPPLQLALLQEPDPDTVATLMLVGPRPLCKNGEKLATFREMVRAYQQPQK